MPSMESQKACMEIAHDLVSTAFILLLTLSLLHGEKGSIKIYAQ